MMLINEIYYRSHIYKKVYKVKKKIQKKTKLYNSVKFIEHLFMLAYAMTRKNLLLIISRAGHAHIYGFALAALSRYIF